jgi:hypothetical protein
MILAALIITIRLGLPGRQDSGEPWLRRVLMLGGLDCQGFVCA